MNISMWLLLVFVSFMSVGFMMSLYNIKSNKKYRYFRYYSYVLVAWSIVSILRNVIREPFFIYHLGFLVYPIVFLVTSFLYMTIKVYTGGTVHKFVKIFVAIFFVIDLVLSLTNSFHHLVLNLDFTSMIATHDFGPAVIGIFFYIHTIVCYALMFTGLYELLKLFIVNVKKNRDMYPFLLFSTSIVFGIILNIIHVFFIPFAVDPTFVFMILVGVIMLDIFKKRDLMLILSANDNRDILDSSRELYIISNHQGLVVDCSTNLKNNYQDLISQGITLGNLKKALSQSAILYYSEKDLDMKFDTKRKYYHVKEQRIRMPHFLYYGRITLLYDETADMKLLTEKDWIMSHDIMTGIYNRNYFEGQIPLLEKSNHDYGVILMDVDGLKLHNDYFGHKAGDQLLIKFSKMMVKLSNKYKDILPIRLGGDEFLFLAKKATEKELLTIAEELLSSGKKQDPIKCVCFSYGISIRRGTVNKFGVVLKEADRNMYIMKNTKAKEKLKMEEYFKTISKTITS